MNISSSKIIIALFVPLFALILPSHIQAQARPNFIIILTDDLDEDSLNTMLTAGKLPNIQQLINHGTRFDNSFVVQSMCCPSRATLISGKYSHNTGVYSVVGRESGMGAFDNHASGYTQNLAVWLQNHNYYTGYIGKTMNHNGPFPNTTWNGYDFWRKVSGFDTRPRQYRVHVDNNNNHITPDQYQTKYIADQVSTMINNFPSTNKDGFLTIVAPNAPHIFLPKWDLTSSNFGPTIIDPNQSTIYDGLPIISFNAFNHQDGYIIQQSIKGNPSTGYGLFARGSAGSLGNWSFLGHATSIFTNTGSRPIVSFNAYVVVPENRIRQHLLRGNPSQGYELYYRDQRIDGGYDGFTKFNPPDGVLFPETGSLPMISFTITNLDGSTYLQELIRGDSTNGYYRYSRTINPNTNWYNEDLNWDHGTGIGEITAYNNLYLGDNRVRHQLIRFNQAGTHQLAYHQDLPSIYNPQSSVAGIDSEKEFEMTTHMDEGEQMTHNVATQSNNEPHLYYSGRLFADGAWAGHRAEQSFSLSAYGGTYPAGSLRSTNNHHGYLPLTTQFGLPTHKNSFNYVDCVNQPSILCTAWPDLNQVAFGNRTQGQYLARFHLDRLESLIGIDAMVGQIIASLNANSLYQNTFIIFTSDNGHFVGEHRLSNKIIHYEESARVPLIIKPPQGHTGNSFMNLNTVANIDLTPTILDYAGLNWQSTAYNVDGRSLRPIISNRSTLYSPWRRLILYEGRYPRNPANNLPYSPMPFNSSWDWAWAIPDHYGIRIGLEATSIEKPNHNTTLYYGDPYNVMNPETPNNPRFVELYNINQDPYQINNLFNNTTGQASSAYTSHYDVYKTRINQLRTCAGQTCRNLDSEPLNIPTPTPTVPYSTLTTHFNKPGTPSQGDLNNDGIINIFDLNMWVNQNPQPQLPNPDPNTPLD